MKKLLLLHGWDGNPDINWLPYVRQEAENLEYSVHTPFLKDNANPTLSDWTKCALENFELDKNTTIIGHSLGAVLALKLLQQSSTKIDTLILVSGWDFWDLTPEHKSFFNEPIDHKQIKENVNTVHVVHGSNDPYITFFAANEMGKRLGAKSVIKIANGGHLQEEDGFKELPQILPLLK